MGARLGPLLALAGVLGGCAAAGEIGASPYPGRVGAPPAGLGAETVAVPVRARAPLAGWWVPAPDTAAAIVLLHGHTDDRTQMLDRARLFADEGYAVLLADLPAHGESAGERVTFGVLERFAASAAVDYARARGHRRVGVVAVSLGAAAASMAGEYLDVDALVLESMFPTFEAAVRNRARRFLGPLSPSAARALLGEVPHQLGVPADSVRPVVGLARTDQPTFVIGGAEDRYTPPAETRAVFEAAPEPRELWIVEGTRHEDYFEAAPEEYRARVLGFLDRHLRR